MKCMGRILLLTDADITEIVKAVGARRKLIVKRNNLTKPSEVANTPVNLTKVDKKVRYNVFRLYS